MLLSNSLPDFAMSHSTRLTADLHAGARSLTAGIVLLSSACSRHDTSARDSTASDAPAASAATAAPAAAQADSMTPVRGTLTTISDTALTVKTGSGTQQIRIIAPLHLYTRKSSDLAHVKPNTFVGITSVPGPNGTQRATEIHIFPEELRGTGEGSRLMEQTAGSSERSTMTNGSVSASRMANGGAADSGSASASRMTNGSVATTAGGKTYTIKYQGGTQTIEVPSGVTVTAILRAQTKPAAGSRVVVLARTGPDGRLSTSAIMLAGSTASK
jgi:hypothetical protein